MDERYRLREATPADAAAVDRLMESSPDGGAVQFRLVEHVRVPPEGDGLTQSRRVVATDTAADPAQGQQHIVGSATVRLGRFRYEGGERPFALLGALQVHPAHRRRGIGAELARWRIGTAERLLGTDVVVLADIQNGNVASMTAARRWSTALAPRALAIPARMRRKPPRAVPGVQVRSAEPADLAAVARGVTAFTAEQNFARIWTPERLTTWLAFSPLTVPVRHYLVATDRAGSILAGLALREEALLHTMQLVRMPVAIRAANTVLRAVPRDCRLRNLAVEHVWFAPGREDAAAALWQDVRWSWRTRGSNLLITIDPRSPVRPLLGLQPWHPRTSLTTAVRADPAPDPARLVAPIE